MKARTQLILILTAIAALTVTPAAIVWVVDPVHMFRSKSKSPVDLHHLPRHQNAGLIRSYLADPALGFDTIIMGTSLSLNCAPSQVQETLGSGGVIKMAMSGSMPGTQVTVVNRALEEDTVKRVIWEINDRTYAWLPIDAVYSIQAFPEYLYGGELGLYQYLFNFDHVDTAASRIGLTQPLPGWRTHQGDEWASWYRGEKRWQTFRSNHWSKNFATYYEAVARQVFAPFQTVADLLDTSAPPEPYPGVDLVVEVVRLHPDVAFDFYIPPISTAFYAQKDLSEFVRRFGLTRYLVEQIASLANARVFAFNDVDEIVMDLSLYRDLAHYHPDINARIIEFIARGEHQLTTNTIDEYESRWFDLVRKFTLADLNYGRLNSQRQVSSETSK